jgi:hypothetical protein
MVRRRLTNKVAWDSEAIELELLDWESSPADFERLVAHVTKKAKDELDSIGIEMSSLATNEEVRGEIRKLASTFEEKYVSLPNYVYWGLKGFLIRRKKQKQ